ncbi:MAG: hypothetical protein P1U74_08890 [Legionellaceae bacterium]|nr:hypothetical protein [Legionellaceae bacterium]
MSFSDNEIVRGQKACAFGVLGTETFYTDSANYLQEFGAEGLEETLAMTLRFLLASTERVTEYRKTQYTKEDDFQDLFQHPEDTKADYALHELHDAAAIIDGPCRFKANVYHVISTSLIYLIGQVANGYDKIAFTGHSRGSVITILLSYELNRIKNSFLSNPEMTREKFITIVLNSDNEDTKKILTAWRDKLSIITDDNFEDLKTALGQLSTSHFLLDPVPGGRVFGFTYGEWRDERFRSLPSIIDLCYHFAPDGELSRGFKGLYFSESQNDPRYKFLSHPGNHATASGNPYSHPNSEFNRY